MAKKSIHLGQQGFPPRQLKCRDGHIFRIDVCDEVFQNLLHIFKIKSPLGLEIRIIEWIKKETIKIEIDEKRLIFILRYREYSFLGKIYLSHNNNHFAIFFD